MEDRDFKDDLKSVLLSAFENELNNYVSQRGIQKYFDVNIDKIISENIKRLDNDKRLIYKRVLRKGSEYIKISSIANIIKSEPLLRDKNELIFFGKYLNMNFNKNISYNQILKRISKYIKKNREEYSKKYYIYRIKDEEYAIEPNFIKEEILNRYKKKTKNDMISIAKLLNINISTDDNAEDIRRKIISFIVKEKLKNINSSRIK